MKRLVFFAGVMLCIVSAAAAQSAVVPAGGLAAGGAYTFSYTVGQVAMETAQGGEASLMEGVQQPVAVSVERIDAVDALPEVSVFPNPTTAMVTLKRDGGEETTDVTLFDGTGRVLVSQTWAGESMTIDLTAQPAGVYVLRVAYDRNRVKNYKIIKK